MANIQTGLLASKTDWLAEPIVMHTIITYDVPSTTMLSDKASDTDKKGRVPPGHQKAAFNMAVFGSNQRAQPQLITNQQSAQVLN